MLKSRMSRIEAGLTRLQEGNLAVPFKIEGVGVYRSICKRLEKLRLTMLKMQDEQLDTTKRANNAIASVAHDMKTPLAVIAGYAECLSDGMDDKDYASLILQRTQQMNDMVLEMVSSSRKALEEQASGKTIQSGRVYFSEVTRRLQQFADSKNITVKLGKIEDARLRLDSKQFGRVMQNLVTNAIKYSPAGSTVTVSCRLWAKKYVISVKDHGDGIAKEDLPYVFDQYFRSDKARTDSKSSGLGLYITKEIVLDHGGNISVHSKLGKGSTFYVTLPVEPDIDDTSKKSLTTGFNALKLWQKLLVELLFGWLMASLYRIVRWFETRNLATLMFGLLCMALFPFVWMIDFLSIAVYGKISFLAD